MKKIILLSVVLFLAKSISFSQDTVSYITSNCLQHLKSAQFQIPNGPPIMAGFVYLNDTLSVSGMIGANCGSNHIGIIEKRNDTIFITTVDTGKMTTCDCEFLFEFKIKALVTDTIVNFNGAIYIKGFLAGINTMINRSNFIKLYPNPADGIIQIDNGSNKPITKIEISDVAGRRLKTIRNEKDNIDMSGFNSGIYLIKIETEGGVQFFEKIIKK